jgi:hypothetical protein
MHFYIPAALTDIFEKADVSGNGKITLTDYVNMCVVYGIEVSDDEMLKIQVGSLVYYMKLSANQKICKNRVDIDR